MGRKVGIKEASEITGMSKHFIYRKARAGEIPFILSGRKRIFDIELLEEFLNKEALSNVKEEENINSYGQLRRINLQSR